MALSTIKTTLGFFATMLRKAGLLKFESDSLDVFFNGKHVVLTYKEVRIPIYRVHKDDSGFVFEPTSPWGGQALYTREGDDVDIAWGKMKDTIEQGVVHAFQNASPRAKRTWQRIARKEQNR